MSNAWWGRGATLAMALMVAVCVLASGGPAFAQADERRIGPFAVDIHGVTMGYGATAEQAAAIGYAESDLPGRGFGFNLGGQVYFPRLSKVTFGAGASIVRTAGHSDPADAAGVSTGNKADTRFQSIAMQVSANFGRRRGWSYLSAGYGYSTFGVSKATDADPANLPNRATVNFGFGARWFRSEHVAFSFDVRFYQLAAQPATADVPADAKQTRFVAGAGVSFR